MDRAFFPIVSIAVALVFAAVAARTDLRTRRIPNRLVLAAFSSGLLLQAVTAGWRGVLSGTVAALVTLALFLFAFLRGGLGAGDVKWMSAMAAFTGLTFLPVLLIATALAGGCFGLLTLARNAWLARSRDARTGDLATLRSRSIPYALPIACGVLAVLCHVLRRPA